MKLWYEPEVYCVGRSKIDLNEMQRFAIDHGFNPDAVINPMVTGYSYDCDILPEFAGRVCYMSFDKGRPSKEYLEHILQVGHGSVLEHSNISLLFTGVSRSLTHELVRHRAGFAYSQLSQRFVNEENVGFVIPPLMIGDDVAIAKLTKQLESIKQAYTEFVDVKMEELGSASSLFEFAVREGFFTGQPKIYPVLYDRKVGDEWEQDFADGWIERINNDEVLRKEIKAWTYSARKKTALEASRSVLPNCTETKIVATANGRAWRHFLGMRGSIQADREIRRLACKAAVVLKKQAPLLFQDVGVETNPGDGLPYLTIEYPKV